MDADFTSLDGVHVLVVEDDDDSRDCVSEVPRCLT
jgi:hypothetical protein